MLLHNLVKTNVNNQQDCAYNVVRY